MNTNKEKPVWLKIVLLVVYALIVEFVLMNGGYMLYYFTVWRALSGAIASDSTGILTTANSYLLFIGIWVVSIIFLAVIKPFRPVLKAVGPKPSGNNWKLALLGGVLGLGTNSLCMVLAMLHGDIHLYFHDFNILGFIFLLICVGIQSSAEELLCRGFILQMCAKYFRHPAIIITFNAVFFGLIHLGNSGITVLALINIIAVGILFSAMVYYLDSLWAAFAFHTMWNFSQGILWGLPNSGLVEPYSIFKLEAANARDSIFYNTMFGIESTISALVVLIIVAAILIYWGVKHNKKPLDIWKAE